VRARRTIPVVLSLLGILCASARAADDDIPAILEVCRTAATRSAKGDVRQLAGNLVAELREAILAADDLAANWARLHETMKARYGKVPDEYQPSVDVERVFDESGLRHFIEKSDETWTFGEVEIVETEASVAADRGTVTVYVHLQKNDGAWQVIGLLRGRRLSRQIEKSIGIAVRLRARARTIESLHATVAKGAALDSLEARLAELGTIEDELINQMFRDRGVLLEIREDSSIGRFRGTRLSDDGLAHLALAADLEEITLKHCDAITDRGLAHLSGLAKLEELDLDNCTKITAAGLAHLSGLKRLRKLSLEDCVKIDDAALAILGTMKSLESLDLGDCELITDAGLAKLAGLDRLKKLVLTGCPKLTDEAVQAFERAHEGISIRR